MAERSAKSASVILTGGAGFIGSCFLWKLNQEGITDVVVVDSLDSELKRRNLAEKKYLEFIPKTEFLTHLNDAKFSRISSVVHMGACSSTLLNDPLIYRRDNTEYSKTLGTWAYSRKIQFLYASSGATYGDGSRGFDDADEATKRLAPLNLYGQSKHDFDLWVLAQGLQDHFTGFKFFNVFGPNEYHKGEMRSVICKNFHSIEREKRIKLYKSYKPEYEDGGQKRDFIYIKDAVDIMYYFFHDRRKTGIYNVGTGNARTWNDLARAIFVALGIPPGIDYIEMPGILKSSFQYFTEAKMDKLRFAGYQKPFMSLEDAIKDYAGYLMTDAHL